MMTAGVPPTTETGTKLLQLEGITKHYPGVTALEDVSLDLRPGEVHALLGENGAGKSTLMKILSGYVSKDAGRILVDGREVHLHNPAQARDLGIGMVYQELSLVPSLTVAENVFLNRLPLAPVFNRVDWSRVRSEAEAIFTQLGVSIDVSQRVRSLGLAQRQLTEIARVLAMNVRILIMDEPTSSLTAGESERLFTLLEGLRRRGVGIIYITHRVDEAFRLAQRITVLRDGHRVATLEAADAQPGAVVSMMVGRPLSQQYPKRTAERGAPALEVRDLHVRGVLHRVNLTVLHGEVVGLFGMMGAGRTELARALFGLDRIDSGQILIDGRPVALHSPQEAITEGLGLLTEERKKDGLVLQLAVDKNITLPSLTSLSRFGIMQRRRERTIAARYVRAMNIDTPSLERPVRLLSGGNQQKIALAKWLCTQSKVLIFDEPTRGIDVGAKVEVYELMNHLTENGVAILMISSELPEVVAMSDRVLVMRQGTISAEFARDQATQEAIMRSSVKDKEG